VQVPYRQVVDFILSRLARGKVVICKDRTEGSQTAKVCTEEHKAHKRLAKLGKYAQQYKA